MSDKTKGKSKKAVKDDTDNIGNMSAKVKKTDGDKGSPETDDIFCEKCGNILDISRAPLAGNDDSVDTPREVSDSDDEPDYEGILKKVENGEKLTDNELKSIDIKEMVKNEYYKKMTKKGEIKKQIQDMIEDMGNSDENTQAYMVCKNCLFTKPIKAHLRILTKNPEGVTATHDYINEANYRNRVHMGTMPRTRNFHCSNKECKVYTKKLPQEAIFFRKSADTYETIYVCTRCLTVKMN
ncbi:DNA-dependent RNA polymerase subunit Rpb9 [Yasminevirus sp. GU-2018]|uniref:DNA-dependent RNA polymerase subunit Rpb9 n=1 Tax=Yasminevirus sp. GU-2018 TaxID=2420051 RepID=A0A5K0UAD1_9VIRU|nr:DNA-dependent RNA polymerase subunit Rpb9 [Yasminevirus sp. GU-2018]